jgi:hypothetical protein
MRVPEDLKILFWDVDFEQLESSRDGEFILPRVLEFGRLQDINWLVQEYGAERIHEFLRDRGHPELSPRTLAFWRSYFAAKDEPWKSPPAWRSSSAPWRA